MASIKSYNKKYPVLAYFILTFVISWGAILLIIGPAGIPATDDLKETIGMAILLGPVVSSLILTLLYDGKEGLRKLGARLIRWKVNIRWYAVALLTGPMSTLVSIWAFSFFSENSHPVIFTSNDPSSLFILGIVGGLTVGLFEELGWTGFAVPRLKHKYNIVATGTIVGIIWGAWHFILFWEEESFSKTLPFLLMLTRLFSWLPAYRILMVWVYDNTKSLLVVILMHASLVASLAILDPVLNGKELLIYILIRAALLWILAAIVTRVQSQMKGRSFSG